MPHRPSSLRRREFLGSALTAAAGTAFSSAARGAQRGFAAPGNGPAPRAGGGRLRYALVGTGVRGSSLWGKTLIEKYGDAVEVVGLCDPNPKRLAYAKSWMGAACPTFTDFEEMVRAVRPEAVMVTTVDCFHAQYIRRAMELGLQPMTEKPMCTDEAMVQEILEAERRTGRRLRVTFNYRYGPDAARIREILASGEIGEILSVDFHWYLDLDHGASYFRRWHGFKQFSGSLLVHKASHHFDLLNWWLDAEPVEVSAQGDLRRYGFNGAARGERCMTCAHKASCEFFWDITRDEHLMNLYVRAESEDGYLRDACLFRDNLTTYDTMAVQVRYHNRAVMSYSLNAHMPYEGYVAGFNGTKGRLDVRVYHAQPWKVDVLAEFRLTRNFKDTRTFVLQAGGGSHWGSDDVMQDQIFRGKPDPMGQSAGSRAGALSALTGIAARRSIEGKRPVRIDELVRI